MLLHDAKTLAQSETRCFISRICLCTATVQCMDRKRGLSDTEPQTDSSPRLNSSKRRQLENHRRHQTPGCFWDNLSRQWLTRRTLREFDRRTVWPAIPIPQQRTVRNHIDLEKLKNFARCGGPSLDNIRGVSLMQCSSGGPSDWQPSIRSPKHQFIPVHQWTQVGQAPRNEPKREQHQAYLPQPEELPLTTLSLSNISLIMAYMLISLELGVVVTSAQCTQITSKK